MVWAQASEERHLLRTRPCPPAGPWWRACQGASDDAGGPVHARAALRLAACLILLIEHSSQWTKPFCDRFHAADVVADVNKYKEFVPFCEDSVVLRPASQGVMMVRPGRDAGGLNHADLVN